MRLWCRPREPVPPASPTGCSDQDPSQTGSQNRARSADSCRVRESLDPFQIVRHTLRHTAITHLVQAGIDLPTVKRISGHKTLAMVERYSHQNGEHTQTAMDRLESRYQEKRVIFSGRTTQELHKTNKKGLQRTL
ncbi:MAG: tyrosine-type recombinase/integrase [Magnetococcales bacterium]|nr:tyrosine-type recombinase/integrase [Magnetococcales bacterium]